MRKTLYIFLSIAGLAVFIIMMNYIYARRDTVSAQYQTIEVTAAARGFFVRDESVAEPTSGVFSADVDSGERVSKGQRVGTIVLGEIDEAAVAELADISARIEKIEKSNSIAQLYAKDDARLAGVINTRTQELIDASAEGDYARAAELESEIVLLSQRKAGISESEAADGQLAELRERRGELEERIGSTRKAAYSMRSGIFTTKLDSFENVFTPWWMDTLDCQSAKEAIERIDGGEGVISGDYKIINNFTWYAVMVIPYDVVADVKSGSDMELQIDDGEYMPVSVVAVTAPDETGDCAIILNCTRECETAMNKRTAEMRLMCKSYAGLRVPMSAVRIKDGVTGVYVTLDGVATFKTAEIIYRDGDHCLLSDEGELRQHDNVLINPEEGL